MAEEKNFSRPYYLIPLSAKTRDALHSKLQDLAEWLELEGFEHSIQNIAYTLFVGRSHFSIRSVFLAKDLADLKQRIQSVLDSGADDHYLYGELKKKAPKPEEAQLLLGERLITAQQEAGRFGEADSSKQLQALATMYVNGYPLDWKRLYQGEDVRRISLPTYPFAGERYWTTGQVQSQPALQVAKNQVATLHPLLDSNESSVQELCFKKVMSKDEFYLRDSVVTEGALLPGVLYLEMARVAGELITNGNRVGHLRQVVWSRPPQTLFDGALELRISLYPRGKTIDFEVNSDGPAGQRTAHCQGTIEPVNNDGARQATLPLATIQNRCNIRTSGDDVYRAASMNGVQYGPSMRSVQELLRNENEALVRLAASAELTAGFADFTLHPALLEGALQAAAALTDRPGLYVADAVGEVEMYGSLTPNGWAYATRVAEGPQGGVWTFDIQFADADGRVLARLQDFSIAAASISNITAREIGILNLLQGLERGELEIDQVDHLTEEILNG